jgi:hypothetical protein
MCKFVGGSGGAEPSAATVKVMCAQLSFSSASPKTLLESV